MGIFSRISDIVNANINALLDSAENPEKMIRLVIQEMEETLVEVRTNSAKILSEKKDLRRRQDRLQSQAEDWQAKAELALSREREDLAKAALVEKTTVTDVLSALAEDTQKLDDTLAKLSDEIEQLQLKLNDARARQKVMTMRTQATQNRVNVNRKLYGGDVDAVINKFDHFEKKIDQMESEIEASSIGSTSIHQQFQQLEMEEKINDELQALKTKLKVNTPNKPESNEEKSK